MEQNNNEIVISEQQALATLQLGYGKAEEILKDEDKFERLLQRLEKKLSKIPEIGGGLAAIPGMISPVKSYVKKEYTELPIGSIVAIISALLYFVSPIDIIADVIPGIDILMMLQ